MSAITARLAPIEGASQNGAPRPQRKKTRRALINLARTSVLVRGIGLAIVTPLSWKRWIAGLTDQSADNAYLRADTTPISARVNGLVMVLIAEEVALHEIPGIVSLVHIIRTVGWQRIGTLFQILSSRLLEADVGARAAMALVARALQPEAFVMAFCSAFRLLGIMMLVSILAALCLRQGPAPGRLRYSPIEGDTLMAIRTPSIVDGARIRPIPADVLQGE